jgi:hypothetical protein
LAAVFSKFISMFVSLEEALICSYWCYYFWVS